MQITEPGLYDVDAALYHADCVVEPSLSHSIARLILDKSMRHARYAHPRLTPDVVRKPPTQPMEEGTVLHHLILEKGERVAVIQADDWRKNATKDAGKAARAKGQTPVLQHRFEELKTCADAVLEQMREHEGCIEFFDEGASEIVMAWQIGPIWCRSLVDRIPEQPGAPLFDLKSTGQSAAPKDFERAIVRRYASQAVFYLMGARLVLPEPPSEFRFVTFETDPPYGLSVMSPGQSLLDAVQEEIMDAVKQWAKATITGEWPGYSDRVEYVEAQWHQLIRSEAASTPTPELAEAA